MVRHHHSEDSASAGLQPTSSRIAQTTAPHTSKKRERGGGSTRLRCVRVRETTVQEQYMCFTSISGSEKQLSSCAHARAPVVSSNPLTHTPGTRDTRAVTRVAWVDSWGATPSRAIHTCVSRPHARLGSNGWRNEGRVPRRTGSPARRLHTRLFQKQVRRWCNRCAPQRCYPWWCATRQSTHYFPPPHS